MPQRCFQEFADLCRRLKPILGLPRKLAPTIDTLASQTTVVESSQADDRISKLDLEFLGLVTALEQEIDSLEKQLMHSVLDSRRIELPAQNAEENELERSEPIEREFSDGVKDIEQQLDQWILELKAKGKS